MCCSISSNEKWIMRNPELPTLRQIALNLSATCIEFSNHFDMLLYGIFFQFFHNTWFYCTEHEKTKKFRGKHINFKNVQMYIFVARKAIKTSFLACLSLHWVSLVLKNLLGNVLSILNDKQCYIMIMKHLVYLQCGACSECWSRNLDKTE